MLTVLDPLELAQARADVISTWPDTAHVLRGGGAGPGQTVVQPAPATGSGVPVSGGVSDGRGGFRFTAVPPPSDTTTPPPAPATPGADVEIGSYPCSVRSMPRPAPEQLEDERITARELYKISLPVDAVVDVKDRVQISQGRADSGWTRYPGGPTSAPNGVIYEVTGMSPARSDSLSLEIHVEVWE